MKVWIAAAASIVLLSSCSSVSPPTPTSTPKLPTSSSPVHTKSPTPVQVTGVLPDRKRTPGAINPNVTQANIYSTICVSGWTKTVRPSSNYTTGLKKEQLASGYAYKGDILTKDYEEDHLISLELGGSPTSEKNLWPEPYNSAHGARIKDRLENVLNDMVCASHPTITLKAAQRMIATDWWTASKTLGLVK